jgi:choline dehydrogenase-like flavoprotein
MVNNTFRKALYDLCIIGTGPAGIVLALEYHRLNPQKTILLVEYGDKALGKKNDLDDSILVENKLNHHDPYECTNKGLGGTSATWGGRCVMYDEIDFTDRPILSGGCTWNLDLLRQLEPYLAITASYFECGRPIFNIKDIEEYKDSKIAEGFINGNVIDSVLERWSMPTRFGQRYKDEISKSNSITLCQGYEARQFSSPNSNGEISTLVVRNIFTKDEEIVTSKKFVIAAGAQESTRILLRNKQLFCLLKKTPDALGKYYQSHLSGKIASIKFKGNPAKTDYGFIRDRDNIYVRRRFQYTTEFLAKRNLLNTAIWLDNPLYYDPKHHSGAMSFMYLAMISPLIGKKLAPPAIAQSITKGKVYGIKNHLVNIVKQFPNSIYIPTVTFFKRYILKRKLPGVFLYSPKNTYALHFHAEQIPDISNRMEIEQDGETLSIKYSVLDKEIDSVIQLHEELDACLRKSNCGHLEYWYSKEELPSAIREMSKDGIHQVGTTRIASSPEQGVVDTQLRLWGTKNIFVCSSSVFPTSSQANPTFFLGAFAVRLANYLSENENS